MNLEADSGQSADNNSIRTIGLSVIGLGKLGAPMAAVFAGAGYSVCGVDVDEGLVHAFNDNQLPFEETGLVDELIKNKERLSATTSFEAATRVSDISFVIVPTPTDETGMFNNNYVLTAVEAIGQALAKKDRYHLVVVTSTVMPGSTGGEIRETLEKAAGRSLGDQLGLCYSPEFIALGSVVRDMKNPDLVLIGQSDDKAGKMLEQVYRNTCVSDPRYLRIGFANAELAKIAINTFVTTKISYINMLSEVCEHLEAGDVDAVSAALGADSRIGSKYIKGGVAYGGPCFPRDNKALSAFARSVGVAARVAEATDSINIDQTSRLVAIAKAHCGANGKASILGLSYKIDTAVTEESAGITLMNALLDEGYEVKAFDPAVDADQQHGGGELCSSIETALAGAQLIFVMTPWQQFLSLPDSLKSEDVPRVVIDPWRLYELGDFSKQVTYIALGRG